MVLVRLRPRDGWRTFVGEVGVIVLGVMIALGGQQAADEWRWRQEVARTKADLDSEILGNAAHGAERVAVNRCLTDRLAALGRKIAVSDGRWTQDRFRSGLAPKAEQRVNAIPIVYRAPSRVFTTDAWEQAKSTGVLNHMQSDEVSHYSGIYEQISHLRSLNQEEWGAIPGLSFLAFDGRLDADLRERALSRVATLDSYNSLIVLIARQIASAAEELDGRLSDTALADLRETLAGQRTMRGECVDASAAFAVLKPLMRGP